MQNIRPLKIADTVNVSEISDWYEHLRYTLYIPIKWCTIVRVRNGYEKAAFQIFPTGKYRFHACDLLRLSTCGCFGKYGSVAWYRYYPWTIVNSPLSRCSEFIYFYYSGNTIDILIVFAILHELRYLYRHVDLWKAGFHHGYINRIPPILIGSVILLYQWKWTHFLNNKQMVQAMGSSLHNLVADRFGDAMVVETGEIGKRKSLSVLKEILIKSGKSLW